MVLLLPEVASAESTERFLVQRDPGLSAAERADVRADAGVRLVDTLPLARTEIVAAPAGRADEALAALRSDPDVTLAFPEPTFTVSGPDPDYPLQWALENTGQFTNGIADADLDGLEAWNTATGVGQTVAVVDSGADLDHYDLAPNVLGTGVDYVQPNTPPDDLDDHGTHVSGIIAGVHDNDLGITGLAYDAKILPLRVINGTTGSLGNILSAFEEAGERNVRVVNASLGTDPIDTSDPDDAELARLISDAFASVLRTYKNTLYVVAAGNEDTDVDDFPVYPCNTPSDNLVCVGATDDEDLVADFSNTGLRNVDLFAPGDHILSTVVGGIDYMDGTSMATPYVSAIAALLLEADPALSPIRLKQALLDSAEPIADGAGDAVTGARANADLALAWLVANHDADVQPNASDNCFSISNDDQADADTDGYGDACDLDDDADSVADGVDNCPLVYGVASHAGCPAPPPSTPTPTPTPTPVPPSDRDGDGRVDASDGCPDEYAVTADGCPLSQVASLSAKGGKRKATITVRTSRVAALRLTVERKQGGKWKRVSRKSLVTSGNRATLRLKRLKAGRYRVRITISSGAGAGKPRAKTFRVR